MSLKFWRISLGGIRIPRSVGSSFTPDATGRHSDDADPYGRRPSQCRRVSSTIEITVLDQGHVLPDMKPELYVGLPSIFNPRFCIGRKGQFSKTRYDKSGLDYLFKRGNCASGDIVIAMTRLGHPSFTELNKECAPFTRNDRQLRAQDDVLYSPLSCRLPWR